MGIAPEVELLLFTYSLQNYFLGLDIKKFDKCIAWWLLAKGPFDFQRLK